MHNIHDNEILSYEVDLKNRTVVLHTRSNSLKKTENIDITFGGVLAHFFENHLMGSVIFDIEVHTVNEFIESNKVVLKEHKDYGWPADYETLEELESRLIVQNYKYYIITSSYGLNGWVLARSLTI